MSGANTAAVKLERIERNATSFAFLAKAISEQHRTAIDLDAEDFALDDVGLVASYLDEEDLFGSDDELVGPDIKEEVATRPEEAAPGAVPSTGAPVLSGADTALDLETQDEPEELHGE